MSVSRSKLVSNGNEWRKAKARLRDRREECWICQAFGRDATIGYNLPSAHPMSFSADHLVPVSKGGDPYSPDNLAATHLRCNAWRRDMSVAQVMELARAARRGRAPDSPPVTPTTDW